MHVARTMVKVKETFQPMMSPKKAAMPPTILRVWGSTWRANDVSCKKKIFEFAVRLGKREGSWG